MQSLIFSEFWALGLTYNDFIINFIITKQMQFHEIYEGNKSP